MGKVIVKNVVKRKPGHLYYVDGKGNVCEAKMARGWKKKKKKRQIIFLFFIIFISILRKLNIKLLRSNVY